MVYKVEIETIGVPNSSLLKLKIFSYIVVITENSLKFDSYAYIYK